MMNESNFSGLITCATSVLNTLYKDIKDKFPYNPIKRIEDSGRMNTEMVIEIRFEKEKVTFACEFDVDKRCRSSYLFFDEQTEVTDFIEYMKNKYVYDYVGCRWMVHPYYMTVKRIEGITCFMFYQRFSSINEN